jgi:vacuolar-type H+-ATPase subunit I/STV1
MNTTRQRVSITFGFGGLLFGLVFAVMSSWYTSLPTSARLPGLPLLFRLLGPAGLGISFAICQRLRWTSVNASFVHLFAATMLAVSASVCADLVPVPIGFVTALLTRGPITVKAGKAVISHPGFHAAFPVAVGLGSGS